MNQRSEHVNRLFPSSSNTGGSLCSGFLLSPLLEESLFAAIFILLVASSISQTHRVNDATFDSESQTQELSRRREDASGRERGTCGEIISQRPEPQKPAEMEECLT